MSKQKKTLYAGILGVAATALLIDRALLAPRPQEASAAEQAARSQPRDAVDPAAAGPARFGVAAAPFPFAAPDGGDAAAIGVADVRDIFRPTPVATGMLLNIEGPNDPRLAGASGGRGGPTGRRAFEESYKLDAIMMSRDGAVAVVSGRWLEVGDVLDGCELVELSATQALFKCPGGKVALSGVPTSTSPAHDGSK